MKIATALKKLREMRGQFYIDAAGCIRHKSRLVRNAGPGTMIELCPLNALFDEPVFGNFVDEIGNELAMSEDDALLFADSADNEYDKDDDIDACKLRKRILAAVGLEEKP